MEDKWFREYEAMMNLYRQLPAAEKRVVATVAGRLSQRLLDGEAQYGEWRRGSGRDWRREVEEELLDACAYSVFGEMEKEK